MAFSTLVFPFVFLPVSLILYFVLPKRLKNAALAGHVPPEEELLAEAAGDGITPLHGSPECGKII